MANSFYSGKDLCKGEFQLLLYSTWVALPTDGCHKGLTLHHPLNHITVAILVTNAIVKITNHFLQCCYFSIFSHAVDVVSSKVICVRLVH